MKKKNKLKVFFVVLMIGLSVYGIKNDLFNRSHEKNKTINITVIVNGKELKAKLYNNVTTRALLKKLPLTIPMKDLYKREMCYRFKENLPVQEAKNRNYEIGDIIYWPPGKSLVIMYEQNGERFNMQQMGKIENGVEIFKNTGDINVTFKMEDNMNKNDKKYIKVQKNDKVISIELNNSEISQNLYNQLPININIEDYNNIEKIFYPPKKLNGSDNINSSGKSGDVAYYSPWGNVVIFYKDFGSASGLYSIGKVMSGIENISKLSGEVKITKD